jgi:hypothetical protein
MSLVCRSTWYLTGPLIFSALLIFSSVSCGGEPPDNERQQAQGAIDAARAVGADQYAHDEFVAAQLALQNANEAVEQRDYRLALNHALDSRERAQNAAKMAADAKAAARVDADRAISSAADVLDSLRTRIANAESSRLAPRLLANPRKVMAAAERQVQEARTAYEQEDYPRAVTTAQSVTAPITAALKEFPASAPAPARRRR